VSCGRDKQQYREVRCTAQLLTRFTHVFRQHVCHITRHLMSIFPVLYARTSNQDSQKRHAISIFQTPIHLRTPIKNSANNTKHAKYTSLT
jgi:hypothetical protein